MGETPFKSASDLLQIPTAAQPTRGQGLSLDGLGKVPLSALPQTVTGRVAATGSIDAGTGYTITKGTAGQYTVNFTTSFTTVPLFICTVISGALSTAELVSVTTSNAHVATFDTNTSVYADYPFHFLALVVI